MEVGRTDQISLTKTLTTTYDLDLQPLRAMIMTYSHAKVQGQRSIGSEDRVETNERTEAISLPPSLMRSVKISNRNVSCINYFVKRNSLQA